MTTGPMMSVCFCQRFNAKIVTPPEKMERMDTTKWWVLENLKIYPHSMKLTAAKAPENRPKLPQKETN